MHGIDLNYHQDQRFAFHGPPRHGLSVTVCGDRVLVFGGFDGTQFYNRADIVDVAALGM